MSTSDDGPVQSGPPTGEHDATAGPDGVVAPGAPAGAVPAEAGEEFGDRLGLVERFVHTLATSGVERGLLGPREAARLWDRHILNCVRLHTLVPPESTVIDVGSGAGLPGLVLALRRPDVQVTLVEPLLRRSVFLQECVDDLGLVNSQVIRGRAEDLVGTLTADLVTARAVAPLERLATWCLPLLHSGGSLLALKGDRASEELAVALPRLRRMGVVRSLVHMIEGPSDAPPTVVTELVLGTASAGGAGRRKGRR